MSYRIEQNDNDIFFILYDIYLVKKIKIMKIVPVPVQVIFTGKIFYR